MSSWYRSGVCSNNRPAQQWISTRARQGVGALSMLCVIGAAVRGQETPPGFLASLDITQRLEYSDNPDLDIDGDADLFGRTILDFGLESVTKVQSFALNLGTEIEEFRDDNDSDLDVTNSSFNLAYDRNTRNALIGLDLRYREFDTDSSFSDDDFFLDPNVITQDSGTRQSYGFGLEGAVGREAPIGASFTWNYDKITYSDTDDPDLTDSSTNDFSGQIDFRVDPRITTNLTANYIDFDADGNGVNRETTGLGAGVVLEVTPIWTTSLSLSYDRIERTGDEVGTDEGISGAIEVIRAVPNGSLAVNYSSDVESNDNGRRSFLSVNRDMDLPRGALSYSLGVTGAGDVIGTDPLFNIDYIYALPTTSITFGLSQNVVTDNDNEEQINTALRAGFNREINSLSSFGVDVSFFDRNAISDGSNDAQRVEIGLSYRYDLTRDWGLVSGYSYTYSNEDGEDSRDRNTIFVGLSRSFNWTP